MNGESAKRGRFITFEGGEGSGKSTQIKRLDDSLRACGIHTLVTREPGGSPGAEIVRHLVLSGVGKVLGASGEALLFAAARDDHVHNVISPALKRGEWVLCDRFTDSTRVYQGKLGAADINLIRALERVTIGELTPDLTIILDVPAEEGLARAAKRRGTEAPDRFEAEDIDFHRRLRDAYRQVAADEPDRCVLIDATMDVAAVAERVWSTVGSRFTEVREAKALETSGA